MHQFLSGAAMEPEAILAADPGSRFVARARLLADDAEIWGIIIRLTNPDPPTASDVAEVITDDGRAFTAMIHDGGRPTGGDAAILAAAKYWELPPAYVSGLAPD